MLTDCPHREKLSWLEQYHLNGPALRYNFDLPVLTQRVAEVRRDHPRGRLIQTAGAQFVEQAAEFGVEFGDDRRERAVQPVPRVDI